MNEHKFDQRSEVCKHLSANPTHRFNFRQPEILGSNVGQKKLLFEFNFFQSSNTGTPASSQHWWFISYCYLIHNGLYGVIQYERL